MNLVQCERCAENSYFFYIIKVLSCLLLLSFSNSLFANDNAAQALLHGYEAYHEKDWKSAVIFFRQSNADPSVVSDASSYMLIMSQLNAGEAEEALKDCNSFITKYPESSYIPLVSYQKGRSLFLEGRYDESILVLSNFCSENPSHVLFPSALYWIAESFYANYDFDNAEGFYNRIISEYPDDARASEAKRRLQEISQWEREEKLLYLLKVTGEEYLAAKEEYERELKQYKSADVEGLIQQLQDAKSKIAELEAKNAAIEEAARAVEEAAMEASVKMETSINLEENSSSNSSIPNSDLIALKAKAAVLQKMLNEKAEGK
ncbi:MAG: tetratricopeptide repeat protein [Treponema sp.]|nr:tetratricopeptide repeat protein [Treponema sp.]